MVLQTYGKELQKGMYKFMKNFIKIQKFIVHNFLSSLIIVVICTFIMSGVSYYTLHKNMLNWVVNNNNKVLEQYSAMINNLIIANSEEIYTKILSDISSDERIKYFTHSPLINNLPGTIYVRNYLSGIQESNPIIDSAEIFYIKNHLLVNGRDIKYDLFYEFRKNELQPYLDMQRNINSGNHSLYSVIDKNAISIIRPVAYGEENQALIILNYSISALRSYLSERPMPEFSSFYVVGSDNSLIFTPEDINTAQEILKDKQVTQIFQYTSGNGTYTTKIKDTQSVVSYITYEKYNWKYMSIAPISVFIQPITFILSNLLTSVIVTILAGLLLAALVCVYQSKPIRLIITLCEMANIKTNNKNITNTKDTYSIITGTLADMAKTIEKHNQDFSRIIPTLIDNFVVWFLSEEHISTDEIKNRMLHLNIRFPFANYCIIAIKAAIFITNDKTKNDEEYDQKYILAEMAFKLENLFKTNNSYISFLKKDDFLIGIINFDFSEERFGIICHELTETLIEDHYLYMSLSQVTQDICEIANISKYIIKNLDYSFIYPEKKHYILTQTDGLKINNLNTVKTYSDSFISCLKLHNYHSALCEFDLLVNEIRNKEYDIDYIKVLLRNISLEIENMSNLNRTLVSELMKIFYCSYNILALRSGLHGVITRHYLHHESSNASSDKLISNAKFHITSNLLDPMLTLQTVSDALNVSSTYLSRIFPEKENVTFIEYITNAKMEFGRKLLLETELSINEISNKLNYSTPQYFISLFKKSFSVTPGNYRKNHK